MAWLWLEGRLLVAPQLVGLDQHPHSQVSTILPVLPKFFKEHPDIDNVVIQYPLYSNKLIKQITDSVHQNSHAKLYFIIHDAEMIRLYADEPKRAQGELDSFNLSDGIIGHNAKMNKFLKEQGWRSR